MFKEIKEIGTTKSLFKNERQELLDFIFGKLKAEKQTKYTPTEVFLNIKTAHLKLQDLQYIKSIMTDAENRGQNPAKVFWSLLKVK